MIRHVEKAHIVRLGNYEDNTRDKPSHGHSPYFWVNHVYLAYSCSFGPFLPFYVDVNIVNRGIDLDDSCG